MLLLKKVDVVDMKRIHKGFVGLLEVTRSDGHKREFATTKDSVAFLVYNREKGHLVFVNQQRDPMRREDLHNPDGISWEVPAGHIDDGLGRAAVVVKEAREELGIIITEDRVQFLNGQFPLASSPGVLNEVIHLAYVEITDRDYEDVGRQTYGLQDEGEYIRRITIELSNLSTTLCCDLKTWALIQWFRIKKLLEEDVDRSRRRLREEA